MTNGNGGARGHEAVEEVKASGGLGTFTGVFTPSVLTILGIILFLRMGYVVGNAGLAQALIIIAIANTISVLTSFSLAAIATNFEVKGGGDYYLISRTLGRQFGGAIGIVLFLAQSVSIAFYCIGFGEGLLAILPGDTVSARTIAIGGILLLLVLAWMGADWATKFQFGIMAILFAAIGSFIWGAIGSWDPEVLQANWKPAGDLPFWAVFALFFPAVTGFTQGVSMSGDLADPAKSLPRGTFLAVGISVLVYLVVAVLFAGAMPGSELVADYGAMGKISIWPWLISAGVLAATLSSALASFLGAPRILQALASDRLFSFLAPFAVTSRSGNPRRAVLLSLVIALVTAALGDLNVVAPIVSMFFLISYGLLNYATYYEARSRSPSFRPRFRWYHQRLSLFGFLGCGAMMLAIDPRAGVVAVAIIFAIHQYLARSSEDERWADSSRSARFQAVRRHLHKMDERVAHDRDWRPIILAFSNDPERRERIVRFASWIEGSSGLTTVVRYLRGTGPLIRRERAELEERLVAEIRESGLEVFARVISGEKPETGFQILLQSSGVGPIRPNIALFNWFDQIETSSDNTGIEAYGRYLRVAIRYGCSVVVLALRRVHLETILETPGKQSRIDVWWHDNASSRLALLQAYLMTRSETWAGARLRILVPFGDGANREAIEGDLKRHLEEIRIPAEVVLVEEATWTGMWDQCQGATFALVPFRIRKEGLFDTFGAPLPKSLTGLPPIAFVLAAEELDLASQPDEGELGEKAQAIDNADRARRLATQARSEAERAEERVIELHGQIARGIAPGTDPNADLAKAQEAAREAERRTARAEAKADQAEKEARAITGGEEDPEADEEPSEDSSE